MHCGGVTKGICYSKESQRFFSLQIHSSLSLSLQTQIFRIEWRAEVARSSTPILCVSKAGGSATEGSTQVLNEVALEKSQREVISEDEENALL